MRTADLAGGPLILVKGAGDVGSAVAQVLFAAGQRVVLVEDDEPATARRSMSFAEAVFVGEASLEGVRARRVDDSAAARALLASREALPLFVGAAEDIRSVLEPDIVVDARMRKRQQPEVQIEQAPLTIGLGPGFRARVTTDLVVETNWGANLGKVLEQGESETYTGQPRAVMGYGRERYSYAPTAGRWRTELAIGQSVEAGQMLGTVDGRPLRAEIGGLIRGITRDGIGVGSGAKVADVDPRGEQAVVEGISERPRRIAEGILSAVLAWSATQRA